MVLLFSLIPCVLAGQVYIDFESGISDDWIFPENGKWGLDDINPISGAYSLKHIYDNHESGSDIAYFPVRGLVMEGDKVEWQFRIRHAYNPSSSNNWSVILASESKPDQEIAGGTSNGIVLGVNISGYDDTLKLWKQSNGSLSLILSANLNWQNDIGPYQAPLICVERETDGTWNIYLEQEAEDPCLIGSGNEAFCFTSEYFGILYNYTSSCDQLLWIDDIEISGYFEEDNVPPEIVSAEFTSNKTIRISFSEALSENQLSTNSFIVYPEAGRPESFVFLNQETISLKFAFPFKNKSLYNLAVTEICDNNGNCADSIKICILLAYPEWGDLVITEIMTDPDPGVALPGFEYIEIFNRSLFPINLRSLRFYNGSSQSQFPDRLIAPGSYLMICDEGDTSEFNRNISLLGLRSMPALNNLSDYIFLCDTLSGTIHGLEYDKSWFNNQLKIDGGWSLEMIDPDFPFAGRGNWTYSVDSNGGTPGSRNSVFKTWPDLAEPLIENCYALSTSSVRVDFSEPVTDLSLLSHNTQIAGLEVNNIVRLDSLRRSYMMELGEDLAMGVIYTIDFYDIYDYGANILNPGFCQFGLTQKPASTDVIINEVMFEPLTSGSEYVEFYNRSEKIIDAGSLQLTCINLQSMDTGIITLLSDCPRCILPGDYFVITENKAGIVESFSNSDPAAIHEVSNLTTLPDSKGRLLLMHRDLTIIDDFSYYDDYHIDLLSGTTGVSLERISADISTNNSSNWHSATGLSGWGSPGLSNSVYDPLLSDIESTLILSSTRITPDNDGFQDYLTISLKLPEEEWIVDIIIYDDSGYRVNHLCENMSAFGEEKIIWQGIDKYNNILPEGIYIVFVKAVSSSGMVSKWKKVCSILRR